ncbi:MAG: response regulator [Acidobacteriota bacterium]|nr:response regulator [Acidobacteriota bacterium]
MPSPSEKVSILLADEDALRREGLAAVISGNRDYVVMAGVPDGESALEEIRKSRPAVAVVDLNLPRIHGIELVRRVRSEGLGTRIVIMSGSSDDEIIREVVRAGGDGYVLKNGPSRHLLDAISYVRDGGQYFSPQLGRDGRDRHLLEEPPRSYAAEESRGEEDAGDFDEGTQDRASERPTRGSRAKLRPRRGGSPFRERIRAEAGDGSLRDRDYEIMSMMADGIKPILDRLDEIDDRVAMMETGEAPVPSHPRDWLDHEIADSLGPRRSETAVVVRSAADLEARLPAMIEEAVTNRFNQMASNLQQEIEETHVRTLEAFVKNIQVKLVQRVSALEQDMSKQAEAMDQMRESSRRTEDNLSRLITGVDKLAQDLPKRLAAGNAAARESVAPPPAAEPPAASTQVKPQSRAQKKSGPSRKSIKRIWIGIGALILIGVGVWFVAGWVARRSASPAAAAAGSSQSDGSKPAPLPLTADPKLKLQAAQQYADNKDYPMAEDLYKQVLQAEPNNADAIQGLASVYYREDKVSEAAALLDRLQK